MPRLTICLFGRLECTIDGVGVVSLEARKAQELLSYLALDRTRMHHRDMLSTLLWDDRPELQAKKGLRQALWVLQSSLQQGAPGSKECLLVDGDWIGFDKAADIWVDATALERVYARFHAVADGDISAADADAIRAGATLYRGDLLEGWYQDWCLHERERHQFMYLSLLDKLLGYCETIGDYANGVIYGMRILSCDNARESAHRRLMRLHYLAGHRTRALHQYTACVHALKEELGVAPARSTQLLYRQICEDALADELAQTPPARPMPPIPAPSKSPMDELMHMRELIDLLQRQVNQLIATLQ